MSVSIWVKLLDAYFLVSCQQRSMETDVFLLFSLLGKRAAVLGLCAEVLSAASAFRDLEMLAVRTGFFIRIII